MASTQFHQFLSLPLELKSHILSFVPHSKLPSVALVSKHVHDLVVRILYSRIYLNDSPVEVSKVCNLAPSWTWLTIHKPCLLEDQEMASNAKLSQLLRSLAKNTALCRYVTEVRLNWDLSHNLQAALLSILSIHGTSLRCVENVITLSMNRALLDGRNHEHLITLDLPPPSTEHPPTTTVPDNYIPELIRTIKARLTPTIQHVCLFMDPVLMFNNLHRSETPLDLTSIKLHCRGDTYPLIVYQRASIKKTHLKEIFNPLTLKSLTVISWFGHSDLPLPKNTFRFDQWAAFNRIEDLSLIAVPDTDDSISLLIKNLTSLKRVKLDLIGKRGTEPMGNALYDSLWRHKDTLEFVDVKVTMRHEIVTFDHRNGIAVISIPCSCMRCTLATLILENMMPRDKSNHQIFCEMNFFNMLLYSSLLPYSKALDRFPSVMTNPDSIKRFVERFNRMEYIKKDPSIKLLTKTDFYTLYHCLLHSMKDNLEPFAQDMPRLKFLVINGISFMMKRDVGHAQPWPVFYNNQYISNM